MPTANSHPPDHGNSRVEGKRLPELDGIRGCAILLVLFWHYFPCQIPALIHAPPGTLGAYLWPVFRLSRTGVDLFFVLSGFLIGGILLQHREKASYFTPFYVRRFFRIAPLYFAWLLLFYGLAALPLAHRAPWAFGEPFPAWSYATFLQNFHMAVEERYGPNFLGITWSLALEEQFYLLLPGLIRFTAPRVLPGLLALLIAAAPLTRLYLLQTAGATSLSPYVLLPCHTDALMLGVLCAYGLHARPALAHSRPFRHGVQRGLIVSAALLAGLVAASYFRPGSGLMVVAGHSVLAALYACLLMRVVVCRSGRLASLMRTPLLQTFGRLAYGLYLFHQGVSGLLHGLLRDQIPQMRTPADALVTTLALALTFALAHLSWRYFEKPLVSLGHRFRYETREVAGNTP